MVEAGDEVVLRCPHRHRPARLPRRVHQQRPLAEPRQRPFRAIRSVEADAALAGGDGEGELGYVGGQSEGLVLVLAAPQRVPLDHGDTEACVRAGARRDRDRAERRDSQEDRRGVTVNRLVVHTLRTVNRLGCMLPSIRRSMTCPTVAPPARRHVARLVTAINGQTLSCTRILYLSSRGRPRWRAGGLVVQNSLLIPSLTS